MVIEEVIKESLEGVKSEELEKGLEELKKKIELQYNSPSASPSNYSLALEKYQQIEKLLNHAYTYTEDNMRIAGVELAKAAQLVLEIKVDKQELIEFYKEQIKFANLLLCTSKIYTSFWHLLVSIRQKSLASKLKGFVVVADLVVRIIDDFSGVISLRQWEEIQKVSLFLKQSSKTGEKLLESKKIISNRKEINHLAGFILWECKENINRINLESEGLERRKKALKALEARINRKITDKEKIESQKYFEVFKEIVDGERTSGLKLYTKE